MSFLTQPKRKDAFTLVEVMVAMAIFTMVILGGILGVRKGFELVGSSRHYTRGSQILQSELELLRTLPWNTFSALNDTELTTQFNTQITEQFGAGVYTGSVLTTSMGGDKMEVKVRVRWSGRSGRVYRVQYTTYFTDGGLNDYYIN